jgi:hypothetical protein
LPDLERWARVIAHFLRRDGFFYVTEAHPVVQVWDVELPVRDTYADRHEWVRQTVEYGWKAGIAE